MEILVIAPHPDDEVLGCGGTIAWHSQRGDTVHTAIVTCGIPELYPIDQVNATRAELAASNQVLGISTTHFLDFPAPVLDMVPGYRLASAITQLLYKLRAQIVYIPHRGDLHADHRAVYLATLVASRPLNGCPVQKLLCYETLSETNWAAPFGDDSFIPTVFVDISQTLEQKLSAMACYKGQLKQPPHPRSLEAIKNLANIRGTSAGLYAAEAFMVVREIIS